jgi:hypothetical protein
MHELKNCEALVKSCDHQCEARKICDGFRSRDLRCPDCPRHLGDELREAIDTDLKSLFLPGDRVVYTKQAPGLPGLVNSVGTSLVFVLYDNESGATTMGTLADDLKHETDK